MFKKTMTFDDLDGNEVTETFYFNYNKKEIAELMEFGYLSEFPPADPNRRIPLEKQLDMLSTPVEESGLTQQENTRMAYNIFQDLILDAFGKKSANNVSFEKNEELRNYFKHHVAFVEMIFEFVADTKLANEFIENCLPTRFVAEAKAELEKKGITSASLVEMSLEAERRQKDPATRIEPGPEAAAAALGTNPGVADLAQHMAKKSEAVDVKSIEDLTEHDIMTMPEDEFGGLDIQKLNKQQMMAAFRRKSQG